MKSRPVLVCLAYDGVPAAALLDHVSPLVVLLYTGTRMWRTPGHKPDLESNPALDLRSTPRPKPTLLLHWFGPWVGEREPSAKSWPAPSPEQAGPTASVRNRRRADWLRTTFLFALNFELLLLPAVRVGLVDLVALDLVLTPVVPFVAVTISLDDAPVLLNDPRRLVVLDAAVRGFVHPVLAAAGPVIPANLTHGKLAVDG
jgi:hypothetical protein